MQANADEADDICTKFRVTALPTFIVFKGKEIVRTVQGLDMHSVKEAVDSASSTPMEMVPEVDSLGGFCAVM